MANVTRAFLAETKQRTSLHFAQWSQRQRFP